MQTIDSFTMSAGYFWLSNFYESDILGYGSTEAFYQAMKTADLEMREPFKKMTPKESKKAGHKLQLRDDWEVVKDAVMMAALEVKFNDPELRQMLQDTYPAMLIEGNTWHDNYWGDCNCFAWAHMEKGSVKTINPACEIPGKNMLGTLLMIIRESWRAEPL